MERTIKTNLTFRTPSLPNFIFVNVGFKDLDSAIANDGLVKISVKDLDSESIEAIIDQWAEDFRKHCKK